MTIFFVYLHKKRYLCRIKINIFKVMKKINNDDLKKIQLDLLQKTADFCEKEGLTYFLFGGTLIGAIRHKGFIPWDDDIDIAMPRPDYDKFIKTFNQPQNYYQVIDMSNDKEYGFPFAKVRDTRTFVDELQYAKDHFGVYIDIFPLDGIDEDQTMAQNRINRVNKCRRQCFRVRRSMGNLIWRRGLKFNLKTILLKLTYKNKLYLFDRFISICQEKDYDCSKFFSTLVNPEYSEILPKSSCDKFLLNKFENTEFYVMNGFDLCLRSMYGNYMQLPPVEKRIPKQDYLNFYWR